mgnify:CR=1 FL=1
MDLEPGPARAFVGGRLVAEAEAALIVREHGRRPYPPVAYFSRDDLKVELQPADGTTHCPLKGTASYYDLVIGDRAVPRGAWSYEAVLGFDPELEVLRDRIAFDPAEVRVTVGEGAD